MKINNKQYLIDVGELFNYEGVLLLCCKDTANKPCYFKKKGRKSDCIKFACCKAERPDKKGVKFVECEDNKKWIKGS